jgi:hypothetical protein
MVRCPTYFFFENWLTAEYRRRLMGCRDASAAQEGQLAQVNQQITGAVAVGFSGLVDKSPRVGPIQFASQFQDTHENVTLFLRNGYFHYLIHWLSKSRARPFPNARFIQRPKCFPGNFIMSR